MMEKKLCSEYETDIQLIKGILQKSDVQFARSYAVFFAVATCYLFKLCLDFFLSWLAPATLKKMNNYEQLSLNSIFAQAMLGYLFPLIVFGVLIWMIRRYRKQAYVMANHLMHLWGAGLSLYLVYGYVMMARRGFVLNVLHVTEIYQFYLPELSIDLFVLLALFTVLYYATGIITQCKQVFWTIGFVHFAVVSVCAVVLPVFHGTESQWVVAWGIFQYCLPSLLMCLDFLAMGIVLHGIAKREQSNED